MQDRSATESTADALEPFGLEAIERIEHDPAARETEEGRRLLEVMAEHGVVTMDSGEPTFDRRRLEALLVELRRREPGA
jgi:hypothetical protein